MKQKRAETELLQKIKSSYQIILQDKLVGIYVHGSIAFQCFTWENSDIDFLVVVNESLSQAEKEALIAEAEGQTARFNSLYEEYVKFPLITKERMFYETMEEVLPNMKIYITDGETQSLLPLEPFSTTSISGTTNTSEEE